MAAFETVVNQPVTLPFTSVGMTIGIGNPETIILANGAVTTIVPTFVEIGSGLYTLTFTPTSTGIYTIFVQNQIIAINVVAKSVYTFLQNIEDEAIGSWQWDKTAGTLSLLRQDGSSFVSFNVVDNMSTASRERQ